MAETYGWGDTALCAALCALGCLACGANLALAAVQVGLNELANYEAP